MWRTIKKINLIKKINYSKITCQLQCLFNTIFDELLTQAMPVYSLNIKVCYLFDHCCLFLSDSHWWEYFRYLSNCQHTHLCPLHCWWYEKNWRHLYLNWLVLLYTVLKREQYVVRFMRIFDKLLKEYDFVWKSPKNKRTWIFKIWIFEGFHFDFYEIVKRKNSFNKRCSFYVLTLPTSFTGVHLWWRNGKKLFSW